MFTDEWLDFIDAFLDTEDTVPVALWISLVRVEQELLYMQECDRRTA